MLRSYIFPTPEPTTDNNNQEDHPDEQPQPPMTTAEFHDGEVDKFIAEATTDDAKGSKLLTRFREDITVDNLMRSTNSARRKLRDYLENHEVPCGRGTGDSIQVRLLSLLNNAQPTSQSNPPSQMPSMGTSPGYSSSNTGKRDFLKSPKYSGDQYSGPYSGPILSTVQRKFKTDCEAHEVPEDQRISVLHVMFRNDALRYFTDHVAQHAASVDDVFKRMQDHFMTPAHKDTYTTEWNTLSFEDMKRKEPDKTTSQHLDILFQRARDLQSMLDDAYQSPLLLRDCIIKAVKSEPFYAPLMAGALPTDPNILHTRLHQCIRQQETASNASANEKPQPANKAFFLEEEDEDVSAFDVHYNERGQPYFKRRIMRGSSSFSTPDYRGPSSQYRRGNYRYRGRGGNRDRPDRHVTFAPPKVRDRAGNIMHCSFCNSWFHLIRNCPERNRSNTHFSEQPTETDQEQNNFISDEPNLEFDHSVDEYNMSQTQDPGEKQHQEHLYLSLTHCRNHELESNPQEYYMTDKPEIPPHLNDVLQRHPHLKPNLNSTFHGFCFDEGAPQSVTGVNQWIAYLRTHHLPTSYHDIHRFETLITFGGKGKQKVEVGTVGRVRIRVPLPGQTYFDYHSLLILNDVPMLFGLATQIRLHTITEKNPDNPKAHLRVLNVIIPLVLKFNHLYYESDTAHEFLFSSAELAQIHRNLGHAPPGSVYSALRRAYPVETGASDLQKLQEISKSCKGCQMFSKQPNRYRAILPDQCVFNFDVAIDVMFIRGQPILHAVCRQTHFSRAAPLAKQDSYTIWETFMAIWVTPYLGVPYNLWVDQAKSFLSVQFKTLTSSLGCNLVPIAVEAHWSLIAERYHDPLRRIANKLVVDHPSAPLHLIIDYANLAMSHTVGPEGFTPAILAFGAQPRLPIGEYMQLPQTVTNRMDLMTSARREYEAIVSQLRIRRAMNSASPNEVVSEITPGDEVLVYREKKGWDGPYTFLYRDGRLSVVLDDKGREHLFHSTMLKPYKRPNMEIKDLLNPADEGNSETIQANLVEMVHDEDDQRFTESRQKEFDGIVAKGGVRPIDISELPPDANVIGNRYVLCIKDPGTEAQRFKARWILQGHHDKYRHKIANDSPMLMRMMYRIVLAMSATFFNSTLWTRDVEQAYMQSKPLKRDVFTPAPREAKLPKNAMLKIELPHYGLVESSSCFFDAYYPVFTKTLHMQSAPFDPCFLYQSNNSTICGIAGLATDDSINTGTPSYQVEESEATKAFVTKKKDELPLRFLGCIINRTERTLLLSQDEHIKRIQTVPENELNRDLFRTVRGQLLFIAQSSRPDISYNVAQLCQVKVEDISKKDCHALNETVAYLKESHELQLQYMPLDRKSLKLYVFVDSGHNTNRDKTSQLGILVCLVDDNDNCQIVHWASAKCQRITRSMLAGEVYAFSLGYDYGVSLRILLRKMKVEVPLYIFTDAKSIFDTITASKRLRELRLMNEIADIRRAYKDNEITNVAWIRSQQNIADNFTRRNGNSILTEVMRTGKLKFCIEQWVYKEDR